MPPITLLIKPASGLCNMRCRYCFYCDVAENRAVRSYGLMSDETQKNVLAKAVDYAQNSLNIAYQGGEPTLAGLPYFERGAHLAKDLNGKRLQINQSIQTNGYALDENWARFLRDQRFLVGLSLDGIKDIHDMNRLASDGSGTFAQVMDAAELFRRYAVPFNILTVVTAQIARRAEAVYKFFRKNQFQYLQFIACLDPLNEPFGVQPHSLSPEAYGRFLCALFDLWFADFERGAAPSIRDFDNYIQMLMGYPPEACNLRGACGIQYVIEADGSVYPCDFYVLDRLCLGNLNEVGFEEIYRRRAEIGFIEASMPIHDDCQSCTYFSLCRGGCRRHRERGAGVLGKTHFCEAYRMFFPHALPRMQWIARRLMRNG